MDRRDFVKRTTGSILASNIALTSFGTAPSKQSMIRGVGMCDWTMGKAAEPEALVQASDLGLACVQVSVGTSPDSIALRKKEIRKAYESLSRRKKVRVSSVAAGSLLNRFPLATEPMSAVFVIDALEAASQLHAENILTAFFGKGDLRAKTETGEYIVESSDPYTVYRLEEDNVQRVIDALKQIAPRAEDLGVYIGLENTLTAQQNLDIIDAVGSGMLKVYYDIGNSWGNGYDVPGEIRMLGNEMICEVHIKDRGSPLFSSDEAMVDLPACAGALQEIGYDKWLVLESRGRENRFDEDTRSNIAYVKHTFGLT